MNADQKLAARDYADTVLRAELFANVAATTQRPDHARHCLILSQFYAWEAWRYYARTKTERITSRRLMSHAAKALRSAA